jgi:hypothetical protein
MSKDIWNKQASMRHRGGFPLRPPQEVPDIINQIFMSLAHQPPVTNEVVLLGVTPEYVSIPWPSNVSINAFDQSEEMISFVWSPSERVRSDVHQAFWQNLPLSESTVDFVLGDGCTTQLADIDSYKGLFDEIYRVIKPRGHLLMRCFVRGEQQETMDRIVEDAMQGRIEHFGTLKWRIAMTIINQNKQGCAIEVKKILETFNQLFADRDQLARVSGWSRDLIDTIDVYSGLGATYTFPNLRELEQLVGPNFHILDVRYGDYELSNCCPIITFQSKK